MERKKLEQIPSDKILTFKIRDHENQKRYYEMAGKMGFEWCVCVGGSLCVCVCVKGEGERGRYGPCKYGNFERK